MRNRLKMLSIAPDDIAICVNYVVEEFEKITGSSANSKSLSIRFERDIENKDGIKILDGDIIVGFCFIEDWNNLMLITSLYVNSEYRTSACMYMIFKYCIEQSRDRNIAYIPLHQDMSLPKNICINGKINKDKVIEWIDSVKSRFED